LSRRGRGFDYAALPADTSALAQRSAEKIKTMTRRMTSDIIGIGNTLQAVKEKLDHGDFLKWVEAEAGISPRTAQRYIGAAACADGRGARLGR
jgi:hypothetical protein